MSGSRETRGRILEYLEAGLTVREISVLLGISTQNIYRHLRDQRRSDSAGGTISVLQGKGGPARGANEAAP